MDRQPGQYQFPRAQARGARGGRGGHDRGRDERGRVERGRVGVGRGRVGRGRVQRDNEGGNVFVAHRRMDERVVGFFGNAQEIDRQQYQPIHRITLGVPLGLVGSTYTLFAGIYGYDPRFIIKRAEVRHRALVENENLFQQILRPSDRFPLFHTMEENDRFLLVPQERYEQNCVTILQWFDFRNNPDGNLIPNFCVRRFFLEVMGGLKFLHDRQIIHRDIRAKNIYVQIVNGTWKAVVSGFKFAKPFTGPDISVGTFFQAKLNDWFIWPNEDYTYMSDVYSVACLMYSFYRGRLILSPNVLLNLQWDVTETDYERLHLKTFIQLVARTRFLNIPTGSYMEHPFFKDKTWMSNYEDRLRTFSTTYRGMDASLEIDRSSVFRGNFLDKLNPTVADHVRSTLSTNASGTRFLDLWLAIRNRKHHRDEDPLDVQAIMGTIPEDYFRFWASTFPYFFMHLFKVTSGYRHGKTKICALPEFSYYFKGSYKMYNEMQLIPLVDDPDLW